VEPLSEAVAHDQEVWFGITFTGWEAKVAALPHWAIYVTP
jgi:hypothetical protein